jgi:hypothetical protein
VCDNENDSDNGALCVQKMSDRLDNPAAQRLMEKGVRVVEELEKLACKVDQHHSRVCKTRIAASSVNLLATGITV